MKIRYETGIATMVQFIVIGLLNLGYAISTGVRACVARDECFVNSFLAMAYFVLLGGWFGLIWMVGYAAQDKRSKRLCQLLIAMEIMVIMVAYFINFKHYADRFGMVISAVDIVLAIWVIFVAFKLIRTGGGRISPGSRPRKRRSPSTKT